MKVGILGTYVLWSGNFATELEIAQRHLDAGDEVVFFACDARLPACDPNPWHGPMGCLRCIARRRECLSRLQGPVRSVPLIRLTPEDRRRALAASIDAADPAAVREMREGAFDAGYAALSSLFSALRDPTPDFKIHGRLLSAFYQAGLLVYLSMRTHLRSERLDRLYVFLGRYAPARAAFRAAEECGVPVVTHELGMTPTKYVLFEGHMRHDRRHIESLIRKAWEGAADHAERARIGAAFFEARAARSTMAGRVFVGDQTEDRLPDDWPREGRKIAIFTSSEHEFVAIGPQWRELLYPTQLEGIVRIARDIAARDPAARIFVRMHPNERTLSHQRKRAMLAIDEPNVTILPPDSTVSTYALMRGADVVVTFGSLTGIEAAYWGKPSVLAAQCYYERLGGTYNPATHEDLVELLLRHLAPRDPTAALMYGHFEQTCGTPFKYAGFDARWLATFRGALLDTCWASRLMNRMAGIPWLRGLRRLEPRAWRDWLWRAALPLRRSTAPDPSGTACGGAGEPPANPTEADRT